MLLRSREPSCRLRSPVTRLGSFSRLWHTRSVSPSSVTECVAYLSQHALPIRCPRYTAQQLSERLAKLGVTYSPETLLAACERLGWPTPLRKGQVVLGMTLIKPRAVIVQSGDGDQVINPKTLAALASVLKASTTTDIPG